MRSKREYVRGHLVAHYEGLEGALVAQYSEKNEVPGTPFAALPKAILHDRRLSSCDKLVWAELARRAVHTKLVTAGGRNIADLLGISHRQVKYSLIVLQRYGMIQKGPGRLKRRALYQVNCDLFGKKQGKEDVVEPGPSGVPRYVSLNHEREYKTAG